MHAWVFGLNVRYSTSPESWAVVALGGLCRGRGCMEQQQQQQYRKRVKALRAKWNQMSEATDRGILAVEQERQRGKFTSPHCVAVISVSLGSAVYLSLSVKALH